MRILSLSNRFTNLRSRVKNTFAMPERFKGTMIEKWATYWRGLLNDYKEVGAGVIKEARTKPRKAAIIGGITYGLYACGKRNPNEDDLMFLFRKWNNEMVMVPLTLQNPTSASYLSELEQAINQNKLRTLSLGICTLLWVDAYDKDDCTFPAICDYTRVRYWNFHERVIDVGFWNHYWRLEWKMQNFDVNYL